MVYTRKKKNQHKSQLSQLDETLNDFANCSCVNVSSLESKNLEQLTNARSNDFKRTDNSVCQNQVKVKKLDSQITRAFSSVLMTVKTCMHVPILTNTDDVVTPRVERAVKLFTGLAGNGTSSEVENPDWKYFLGNIKNNLLTLASKRLDLDYELDRNVVTRNYGGFKDGDF